MISSATQPVPVSIVSTARNRAAFVIVLAVFLACMLLAPFASGLFGAHFPLAHLPLPH